MLCHGHQPLAGEVAKFVPGVHKGVKHLVDSGGFLYYGSKHARAHNVKRNPGDVGRFRWQCVEANCNASAVTELKAGDGEVEMLEGRKGKSEHNHPPSDPGKVGGHNLYHLRKKSDHGSILRWFGKGQLLVCEPGQLTSIHASCSVTWMTFWRQNMWRTWRSRGPSPIRYTS